MGFYTVPLGTIDGGCFLVGCNYGGYQKKKGRGVWRTFGYVDNYIVLENIIVVEGPILKTKNTLSTVQIIV